MAALLFLQAGEEMAPFVADGAGVLLVLGLHLLDVGRVRSLEEGRARESFVLGLACHGDHRSANCDTEPGSHATTDPAPWVRRLPSISLRLVQGCDAACPADFARSTHRSPHARGPNCSNRKHPGSRGDAASHATPNLHARANQPLPAPPLSCLASVVPSEAGLSAMAMPAERMASTLSSARPLPPAGPMRRPGGAVMPAMKPAIGFLRPCLASDLMNSAASSSAAPPISPIMMIELVAGSARNISSMAMN